MDAVPFASTAVESGSGWWLCRAPDLAESFRLADKAAAGSAKPDDACAGPTWGSSCTPRAAGILAADFLHVDTALLKRLYVLVFIEHGTRLMRLGG
jgi:hypothetical protein